MTRRISRIAPWQSAKTLAVVYFLMGLIIAVPVGLIVSLSPIVPGQARPSFLVVICLPVLYALAALILVPLACWVYNIGARWMGGIEVTVESAPEG
jgi:hypothetical protein